jgi:hypothetical protein
MELIDSFARNIVDRTEEYVSMGDAQLVPTYKVRDKLLDVMEYLALAYDAYCKHLAKDGGSIEFFEDALSDMFEKVAIVQSSRDYDEELGDIYPTTRECIIRGTKMYRRKALFQPRQMLVFNSMPDAHTFLAENYDVVLPNIMNKNEEVSFYLKNQNVLIKVRNTSNITNDQYSVYVYLPYIAEVEIV